MEFIAKNQEPHFKYPENSKDSCTLLPNSWNFDFLNKMMATKFYMGSFPTFKMFLQSSIGFDALQKKCCWKDLVAF